MMHLVDSVCLSIHLCIDIRGSALQRAIRVIRVITSLFVFVYVIRGGGYMDNSVDAVDWLLRGLVPINLQNVAKGIWHLDQWYPP